MTKSLELTDKLDAPASPVVNGPKTTFSIGCRLIGRQ